MRKFLLLLGFLGFNILSTAQVDTVFYEKFENGINIPGVTIGPGNWNDTNLVSVSTSHSLHTYATANGTHTYELPSFSTVGKPFVFFDFYHIAKLFTGNTFTLETSIDGGVTWQSVPSAYYRGPAASAFPTGSPSTPFGPITYLGLGDIWRFAQNIDPANTWWVKEAYDLTDILEGPGSAGIADCRVRLRVDFINSTAGSGYYSGYYIDDIVLRRSSCELEKPIINIDYTGFTPPNGCLNKPVGGVTELPSQSYQVSTLAKDDTSGISAVILHWRNRSNGIWNRDTMTTTGIVFNPGLPTEQREYSASMTNILLGDTADWFISAYDLSCPNRARIPDSIFQEFYTFYPQPGYPTRCGTPDCGVLPTTINTFPYLETFEAPKFVRGANATDRGTFPVGEKVGNYWQRVTNPANSLYSWGIKDATVYTPLTGPSSNHTPGGTNFIYVEASAGAFGTKASLVTPCVDLTGVSPGTCMALEFWYHMYGDQMGKFDIGIDVTSNSGPGYTDVLTYYNGQEQDSSTQAWKRGILDLSPYIGEFIRIRFRGEKTSGGERGDIAVDDFKIYSPPSQEFEVLSLESPLKGGCGYVSEPVTVKYRHAGCDTASFIPFAYRYNGGPIVRDTLYGTFTLGDTGTFTFSSLANISAPGTYRFKVWTDASGDGDRSNDTLVSSDIINLPSYNNFPYIEKFEDGTVGTRNFNFPNPVFKLVDGQNNNYGWQVGRELTPVNNTGPWRGYYFDANSKYVYASSVRPGGGNTASAVSTYLQTIACLDFTGMSNPMMTFMYHCYGNNIDRLSIEYSDDPKGETWLPLPNSAIIGATQAAAFTSPVADWKVAKINLSQFGNSTVKIRIKASRNGNAGLASDFAIDNLYIFDRDPQDVGVSRINVPNLTVPRNGFLSPQVTVQNYTPTALTNVPITVAIKTLCGPNAGQVNTYTLNIPNVPGMTGTSPTDNGQLLYTFDHTQTTPVMQFPKGEFEIKVYTSLAGDGNNFNDTVAKNNITLGLEEVTFADNFDSCGFSATGFAPVNGGFRQWELGVPGAPFTGAFSSPNAWTVNKDGNVVPGTTELMRTPDFYGFDSIVAPEIRLYQNNKFGSSNTSSSGRVEFFGANGWEVINGLDPTLGRWFGSPIGELSNPIFGGSPGFLTTTGWEYTWYPMDFLNFFNDTVSMRLIYTSAATAGTAPGGWSIDNFAVYVPPQHSASPYRIRTINPLPVPGNDQPLSLSVQNTGKQLLREYVVEVILDPNTNPLNLGPDTIVLPTNFFATEGRVYTHDYKYVIPASRATAGVHDICVVTSVPNKKTDDIPSDDTLCTTIRILDEFIFDNGTNAEFCNDFDGNLGTFEFFALNNYSYDNNPDRYSWERGTPTVGPGAAFSAPNAWATNLDGNYKSRDSSSLFTNVFVVDTDTNYEVSFMHWYETERATDGGTFMMSDDGGLTWQTVGWALEKNWFNTPFVNALDIVRPGWSDTSGVWDTAHYVFSFEQGDQIVFKFRFESDWDIEYTGWVIDDFCMKQTDKAAQFVIGSEEYNPSQSTFFGELAPNPTRNKAAIPFMIPENKTLQILVTNMMGQTIQQRTEEFSVGSNAVNFETSTWSPGIYNISIAVDGKTVNRKLVVQ
jgi:hypothetical protein